MSKKRDTKAQGGPTDKICPGVKARRRPVFPISREEVMRRCVERGHDMLCAGEALALMDLMEAVQCSILEVHERSHVSRAMIHDLLTMDAISTTDVKGKLARAFHLETIEFELLSHYTLRAEVSP